MAIAIVYLSFIKLQNNAVINPYFNKKNTDIYHSLFQVSSSKFRVLLFSCLNV